MAVTPNYSWPIPVATDYVKDGWDAIADLGNAIDSTVAGLPSGSLTLINTTSFTTQTTVTIDNIFSSTYQNYFMTLNLDTSGGTVSLIFRTAGVDETSGYYGSAIGSIFSSAGASIISQTNNQSSLPLFTQAANNVNFWINNPNSSTMRTMINGTFTENGNYATYTFGAARTPATANTGLKITCGSNMTGTFRIYGLEK